MKTFTFRFEYSVEASSLESAAQQLTADIEGGYDFRGSVVDVLDEENKVITTLDLAKVSSTIPVEGK